MPRSARKHMDDDDDYVEDNSDSPSKWAVGAWSDVSFERRNYLNIRISMLSVLINMQ